MDKKILVTQPFLPPLEEFEGYLKDIWDSKWITNNGKYHQQLEDALCKYLGVKYVSLFSNGTLALITALQALRITGEVITTPFSFVATTHSLWWNNIKPVFSDIDSEYFNLDPNKIESAITPNTTAIMPVHVYGNPCQVEKLQRIADTYKLKLIYDACHAFGVVKDGNSILNYGDLSVLSFHATKVFNTFEGGAIVCHDEDTKLHIDRLKNFGFVNETTVVAPGINAKVNEFQSALGLLQLKYVDDNIARRMKLTEIYRDMLKEVNGIEYLKDIKNIRHNYSYFPILVNSQKYGKARDSLYNELKNHGIFGRRYFYPLISQFPTYKNLPSADKHNLHIAEQVAQEVLCLPLYPALMERDVVEISNIIINYGKKT
jgi:dTDP-4-amino-4,6-dideoxygalactose transaminase